jgi:excisionase family DNA binding protein
VLIFAAMKGYITTTEAAERLGISSARVRQLVVSGKLPVQKFGPVNMVRESDLDLIRDRPSVGRPPGKVSTAKSATTAPTTAKKRGKR